jgi:predicted metal-dependent hydrolase
LYPKAYLDYLYHFHCDRDYFECHEVLEEYWKEKDASEREVHWVGLIQIAVGLYHQRRGNFNGASRMLQNASRILGNEAVAIEALGLDSGQLVKLLEERIVCVTKHEPYVSMNLPIVDPDLQLSCDAMAISGGKVWGAASDLHDGSLVNRHTLRDRSDVIAERQRQLELRKRGLD